MTKMDILQIPETIQLVYVIGRYPELTTTFIEREIDILRQSENMRIQPVSLRFPLTPASISPEQDRIREETLYLIPEKWSSFNFLAFILGNLYFLFLKPEVYFTTLVYLIRGEHPNIQNRLMTVLHFGLGVYAAYLLRHKNIDHLHAHFIDRTSVVALVAGRLLNKPYSLTAHAFDIFTKKILIREKILNTKFMVTVSQYNKKYFLDSYTGLDPNKIHVLHPWVDLSHFFPAERQDAHVRLHILSVGRLVEKKGFADLIEACFQLREQNIDFECRIVGIGPLLSQLNDAVLQKGLQNQVIFVGGKPQSQVLQMLGSWADVFALPCVIAQDGDRDGIPVALAEAMAMELPVISTNIVGISELVRPGTGLLVNPHDPAALAAALVEINSADPVSRHEMGQRGRLVVENDFNLRKGTGLLAELFRTA